MNRHPAQPSAKRPLRVGVVGCGLVAQTMQLPYLRKLADRFTTAALCDRSPGLLRALGPRYGVERLHTQLDALLAEDLDCVLILSSGSHTEAALACIRAGLHVFIEKPMCFTLAEADSIIEEADRQGVTVMVGYMKRYDPAYEAMRARVSELGAISLVDVTTVEPAMEPFVAHQGVLRFEDYDLAAARATAERERALARTELGPAVSPAALAAYLDELLPSLIHELDLIRDLFGDPASIPYAAVWGTPRATVDLAMTFPDGLHLRLGWLWFATRGQYQQSFRFLTPDERLRLSFPSPFLQHEPTRLAREWQDDAGLHDEELIVSYAEAFERELVHFHECIESGQTPRTPAIEARGDIALAQSIARAASR
jgi:predicted dehydrogenase